MPTSFAHFHLCLLVHIVNKNNTSSSEFNSKDFISTKPFTVSSPFPCLRRHLNSLVHTWADSLVAILSLRVQLPWATPFLVSFTRGGAWLLPLERSVPCYFNPLWDDLFNKCLSLFSCRPLCEQTEHVFCFPQIKESIREGATEKEGDNWAIYGFILCRFSLSLPCRRYKMHSASIKYISDLWEKYKWNTNTLWKTIRSHNA